MEVLDGEQPEPAPKFRAVVSVVLDEWQISNRQIAVTGLGQTAKAAYMDAWEKGVREFYQSLK